MARIVVAFALGLAVAGLAVWLLKPPQVRESLRVVEVPSDRIEQASVTKVEQPVAAVAEPSAKVTPKAAGAGSRRTKAEVPAAGTYAPDATPATTAPEQAAPQPALPPSPAPLPNGPAIPVPVAEAPNAVPATPPTPAEPRKPRTVMLPAGTLITVRLGEGLSSARTETGYNFRALLDHPLVADNVVIAERGTQQRGRVVTAEKGGRVKGKAALALELTQLTTSDGQTVDIQTETFLHQAESAPAKNEVLKAGAAAAIGAAIGAIAGGGKGAGIGAAIGGAAGAGTILLTRGPEAALPEETRISFRLKEAVTLTEKVD